MAENLLSILTLPVDASGTFEPGSLSAVAGDKVYTYWDDSANAIVAKLENFTPVSGSNLGLWGDSGNYETAESGWLGAETGKETLIPGNLVRSNTVAHAGTYSAKYTAPSTSTGQFIFQKANITGQPYLYCSAWVYIPSGSPLCAGGTIGFYTPPTSSVYVSPIISATVADCTDTWFQITGAISVLFDSNPFISIKLSGANSITNGVIYIDEFFINEDQGSTSVITTLTDGPILPDLAENDVYHSSGSFDNGRWVSGYAPCVGFTLNRFHGYLIASEFPYAIRNQLTNHTSCGYIPQWVCDIVWVGTPVITAASSYFAADGSVTVEAASNGGNVRYFNGTYKPSYTEASDNQGVFNNLVGGATYTLWAIDEVDCGTFVNVTIPYGIANEPIPTAPNTYAEKYRMDYKDTQNAVTRRVSIYERNFNGTVVEVKGGTPPFVRELSRATVNDKFDPIRETFATVNLIAERNFQFIGLFSQDDRKFQVRYENPAGTGVWRGYVVPSTFSEPYSQAPPYVTSLQVTDGLAELSNLEFKDRDGNKYTGLMTLIKIVSEILYKLDLELSIRIAANISEANHNGIKPFEETQYDANDFYDDEAWKCDRVLKAILIPLGAKLVQEDGYWNIVRVEEQTATYNTRIYNSDGTFNTTGTKNPVVDISTPSLGINSVFAEGGHLLTVTPAYGKIKINHKLFPKLSVLKNYSFKNFDTLSGLFDGWNVDKVNVPAVVSQGDIEVGEPAIQFERFDTVDPSGGQRYVVLTSTPQTLYFNSSDSFTFSFDYRINTSKKDRNGNDIDEDSLRDGFGFPRWVRIGYSIKCGTFYYNHVVGWTETVAFQWNYIWEEQKDKTLNFKIDRFAPKEFDLGRFMPFTVSFWVEGGESNDFQSQAALEGIATLTKPIGYKIKGYVSNAFYYYELKSGTEATSWPDIVRPTVDYHASTNAVYWELVQANGRQYEIGSILIDNVIFNIYPSNKPIKETEELEFVNQNFKEDYTLELEGGDVTSELINSKAYIYRNFFYDQDDRYTDQWTRAAVTGELTSIQNILLKSYKNQYRWPTFKFSGSMVGFTDLGFMTTLKHTQTAPSLSLTNEEFTGSATGWSNSDTGTSWAYDSNDVQVTLSGATDSKLFGQSLTGYAGQRISIEYSITRSSSTGIRGDWFVVAMTQGGNVVQEVVLEDNMVYDGTWGRLLRFSFDNDFDAIHFYVRSIHETGTATYDVDYFRLVPLNIVRYFVPDQMSIDDKNNLHSGEWTQLIPVVFSADPTIDDTGEGNTGSESGGGGGTGGSGGDYNNDYNSDYNI